MRVLVTGGAGFIGRHLVRNLLECAHRVTIFDDLSTGMPEVIGSHPRLEVLHGCVKDAGTLERAVSKHDLIFHLAARVGMENVYSDIEDAFEVSQLGTMNLLRAAGDRPTVLFSSSAVYGHSTAEIAGATGLMPRELASSYDGGRRGYALGKWELECMGVEHAARGGSVLILRPFNVVGSGQSGRYGMVLPRFIEAARKGRPLTVYGDGLQSRCFSEVERFVEVALELVDQSAAWHLETPIIDIGHGRVTTILDLAKTVVRLFRSTSSIHHVSYESVFPGLRDVRERCPNSELQTSLLGAVAWPDIETIVSGLARDRLERTVRAIAPTEICGGSRLGHVITPNPSALARDASRPDEESAVLVLGAGVGGLAAAVAAGPAAILLESGERPGGLVQSECIDGYWFDRVLHLLYFPDAATERRVLTLMDEPLLPCDPSAWVESLSGRARYPIQMHLGDLPNDVAAGCLTDLARETFCEARETARHFEDELLRAFGRALCDEFLLPYNRKLWKRPLDQLAPGDHQWTITRPTFAEVLQGAFDADRSFRSYNAGGFYPRPAPGAPLRGMEILARALARATHDLRVAHRVTAIDLERRRAIVETPRGVKRIGWGDACISTLPLPVLANVCHPIPEMLRAACRRARWNRVYNIAICIQGPRPEGTGLWSYHASPSNPWTRLVYMHAFDPEAAPQDGWGLMAEVTQPAEDAILEDARLQKQVITELERENRLNGGRVIAARVFRADPAYVVFAPGTVDLASDLQEYLDRYDVHTLGRYGRWEYSSMAQVMRDGFALGDALSGTAAAHCQSVS